MSINMANVKSITLGGVSVKKIENLNGDVLWEGTTVTAAPLYLALGGNLYLLDKSTKTFSKGTVTDPSRYFTSSQYIWRGGDTMFFSFGKLTNSSEQKKITISGSELVTTGNDGFFHGSSITAFDRDQVFYNGTDYYVHQGTGAGTTKDYRINLETGALTGVKFSGWGTATSTSTGVKYSQLFKFNDTVYFIKDSKHVGKLSGTNWSSVYNESGSNVTAEGSYFWTPDGVNLYETGGNQSNWIRNVNTWSSEILFSDVTISNPANIFKMNGNVYYIMYDSSNKVYKFYQLKASTIGTNNLEWTDVTSQFNADVLPKAIYSDYVFIEKDGTLASCSCYYAKSQ